MHLKVTNDWLGVLPVNHKSYFNYRVRQRNTSQEMERNWPTAQLLAATGSAWLVFIFPLFPGGHFVWGRGISLAQASKSHLTNDNWLGGNVLLEPAAAAMLSLVMYFALLGSQMFCKIKCPGNSTLPGSKLFQEVNLHGKSFPGKSTSLGSQGNQLFC